MRCWSVEPWVCPYANNNTKKFLKKSQKNILKLKEMLKEQEESKNTQLEEK